MSHIIPLRSKADSCATNSRQTFWYNARALLIPRILSWIRVRVVYNVLSGLNSCRGNQCSVYFLSHQKYSTGRKPDHGVGHASRVANWLYIKPNKSINSLTSDFLLGFLAANLALCTVVRFGCKIELVWLWVKKWVGNAALPAVRTIQQAQPCGVAIKSQWQLTTRTCCS